jgi:CBS domain-containing protein
MRVEEIMISPVVFTQPNVKALHLKEMFSRKNINAVPVLKEDGNIAGIISSTDLISCHDESTKVEDLMTPKVHICVKESRVKDAARVMTKHGVHHLVVMEDGKIIGMISSMDVVKVYSEE